MEKKRMRSQSREVPPELIHRIQSLLPVDEAARTSVVSKSWLHSWSTIPNLRFPPRGQLLKTERRQFIDRTLLRYHLNNIPIESFSLEFSISDQESAYLADKWLQIVSSKSCLKVLSLHICLEIGIASFNLPHDKIFSLKNLVEIYLESESEANTLWMGNTVIKCVFLRVLVLDSVNISEQLLDNLLSTCTLLEKIKLRFCKGFKAIKVKNLPRLCELQVNSDQEEDDNLLEIDNVPSLGLLHYSQFFEKPLSFNLNSLGSVTHLYVTGVIFMDDKFLHSIKDSLHFLEDLTLEIGSWWAPESLVITSASLKWLTLKLKLDTPPIGIQVYAPKLLSFVYDGDQIPCLLFPAIAPEHIDFTLVVMTPPTDLSFFLKMRELLKLSSKFDIHIMQVTHEPLLPLNTDVDDLRNRVGLFPATNVKQLSFVTLYTDNLSFDAIFSICHPSYMKVQHYGNNCFSKETVRRVMEKKTAHLEDVQLLNSRDGNWESLTSSWRSVLDKLPNPYSIELKLNWFSQ